MRGRALAWPPEDVGGTWGHADFVEAIQNEDHERHDEMLEWVEGIAGGGLAFSDSDISHLTPIVYSELHEDFHANPTLVVVGDGWVYCTAEFQRCWEEAIQRALVRAASSEGETGPTALVLKALLNRKHEREPDFYTRAGILCAELVKHCESWTGLPGMDPPGRPGPSVPDRFGPFRCGKRSLERALAARIPALMTIASSCPGRAMFRCFGRQHFSTG